MYIRCTRKRPHVEARGLAGLIQRQINSLRKEGERLMKKSKLLKLKEFRYLDTQGFWVIIQDNPMVLCPNCGMLNHYNESFRKCTYCGHTSTSIYTAMVDIYSPLENIMLSNVEVALFKNKMVITNRYIAPVFKQEIDWNPVSMKYVFNLRTGQSYKTATRNISGIIVDSCFTNITYTAESSDFIPYYGSVPNEVLAYALSLLRPYCDVKIRKMRQLCLAVRFPQLTNKQISTMHTNEVVAGESVYKQVLRTVKHDDDSYTFVRKVCKNLGIADSKANRKMLLESSSINWLYGLQQLGITIDIKRVIVKSVSQIEDRIARALFNAVFSTNGIIFLKELVTVKNQVWVAKIFSELVEESITEIEETMRLIRESAEIWVELKEKQLANTEFLNGTLEDIHSMLSVRHTVLHNTPHPLDYPTYVSSMQCKIDEFTFLLATDTNEMIIVGKILDICVDRPVYTNKAIRKDCFIMFVYNGHKVKACLEISPELSLVQAKGRSNSMLHGKIALAVKQWVEKFAIDSSNCNDYTQLLKNLLQ